MERHYSQLINLALELGQYRGYLDTQDQKKEKALQNQYNGALRTFVYDLLKNCSSAAEAAEIVDADLNEIASLSDEGWQSIYDEVRGDIHAQIDRDAEKKPWQRTLRRRLPLIVGVLLLAVYGGVRLYSVTPVNQPIDSKVGLIQRADALHKVLRYDDWASTRTRRGGWLKGLLLWPIEPTEMELKGATELAGVLFQGAGELQRLGRVCNIPLPSEDASLGEGEIELLRRVTEHLLSSGTQWRNPPVMTVIDPIQSGFAC